MTPIELALAEARAAAARGEVPVGAVVTDPAGAVLGRAGNRVEADHDASAHAEILALRQAARARGSPRLTDCTLTVTLEPCPMCAQAASFFRVRRIVFGAYDPKGGGVEHGARIFQAASCHHAPETIGGVRETECATLLTDFFKTRRKHGGAAPEPPPGELSSPGPPHSEGMVRSR
jgi:tRNA(Arg) A34 adenosine deaminase TadA